MYDKKRSLSVLLSGFILLMGFFSMANAEEHRYDSVEDFITNPPPHTKVSKRGSGDKWDGIKYMLYLDFLGRFSQGVHNPIHLLEHYPSATHLEIENYLSWAVLFNAEQREKGAELAHMEICSAGPIGVFRRAVRATENHQKAVAKSFRKEMKKRGAQFYKEAMDHIEEYTKQAVLVETDDEAAGLDSNSLMEANCS